MGNHYIYVVYKNTQEISKLCPGAPLNLGCFDKDEKKFNFTENDKIFIYEAWNKKSIGVQCAIDYLEDSKDGVYIHARILNIYKKPIKFEELIQENELIRHHGTLTSGSKTDTLLYITDDLYRRLLLSLNSRNNIKEINNYPEYNREHFFKDTFMNETSIKELIEILRLKKNLILQGAPGVGKTYIAKRLAYLFSGYQNPIDIKIIQFHQNYSYEDFLIGYRPCKSGFELETGIFFDLCWKAKSNKARKYILIIDEINRGNINKIFGEAFMLLEASHREETILLPGDISFSIPDNLYIIGTMNTADRSIALLDSALRRRFAFYPLNTAYETEKFQTYLQSCTVELQAVIKVICKINEDISNDSSLGPGYIIGHSYFCNLSKDDINSKLSYVIKYEIIPLLSEYWFDAPEKVDNYSKQLLDCINHD